MLRRVPGGDRQKCSQADMQGYGLARDALGRERRKQLGCEMQARGGRGDGPALARKSGLIVRYVARIRLALTNTAPMAAYRGAGRPVMSYALERLVEHAARVIGMDPA